MTSGEAGCLASHRGVIEYAQRSGFTVLVLEDDITLAEHFDIRLGQALKELPNDWELLYLGGNEIVKGEGYSSLLKRVKKMTGGYGVLVHPRIYDEVLTLMNGELLADYVYMQFQKRNKSFATWKPLILHKQGRYSEIKRKVVDY